MIGEIRCLSSECPELPMLVQKSMRALNVIVRFPVAVVIRPKVAELMFMFGLPQIGLFRILIASVRSVNNLFSPIFTFLLKAISRPKDAGPVMPGILIAVFPVVPGSGFFRTILPDLSTTTWFVNRLGRFGSPPKLGRGALFTERPLKY